MIMSTRLARGICVASATVLIVACDRPPRMSEPLRPMSPNQSEPEFRLSKAHRATLKPGIDTDALEQLLQRMPADAREQILATFQQPVPGSGMSITPIGIVGDDEVQELLARVWAPSWEALGLEQIDKVDLGLPGREIAKTRLLAKQTTPPKR
jgi:hypothetical protein